MGLQPQANKVVGFPHSFPIQFAIFTDNAIAHRSFTFPSRSSPTMKLLVFRDTFTLVALQAGDEGGNGSSSRQNTQCSFLKFSSFSINRCFSIFFIYLPLVNFQRPEMTGLDNFVLFYSCPTLCQKYPGMTEPFSLGHGLGSSWDPDSTLPATAPVGESAFCK